MADRSRIGGSVPNSVISESQVSQWTPEIESGEIESGAPCLGANLAAVRALSLSTNIDHHHDATNHCLNQIVR
jgi:hypothetical protein